MIASPNLFEFIQGWESCSLVAYLDGGTPGVWTIGWGRTKGVRKGDHCTQHQANEWLVDTLDVYGEELKQYLTREPTQQQFDALLDLGYNAGIAPPKGIGRKGIVVLFNAGADALCADRFLQWNKDGGVVVYGLTKRRRADRAMYLYGDYSGRP